MRRELAWIAMGLALAGCRTPGDDLPGPPDERRVEVRTIPDVRFPVESPSGRVTGGGPAGVGAAPEPVEGTASPESVRAEVLSIEGAREALLDLRSKEDVLEKEAFETERP